MASHSHAGHMPTSGKALVISAWLTGIYFVIELTVGLWTGSISVDGDAAQIQGLGFFGLMTIGAHHQAHHLMMAKGAAPHH